MPVNNTLYLRRRSRIAPPEATGVGLPLNHAASVARNLETLGFTFSETLVRAC